jgi:hypothetical protein
LMFLINMNVTWVLIAWRRRVLASVDSATLKLWPEEDGTVLSTKLSEIFSYLTTISAASSLSHNIDLWSAYLVEESSNIIFEFGRICCCSSSSSEARRIMSLS